MNNADQVPEDRLPRSVKVFDDALRLAMQLVSPTIWAYLTGHLTGIASTLLTVTCGLLIIAGGALGIAVVKHGLEAITLDPSSLIQIQLALLFALMAMLLFAAWSLIDPAWTPFLWWAQMLSASGTVLPFVMPLKRIIDRWRAR